MGAVTPDTYVLGPGTLKIGETGELINYSGQFLGATVSCDESKEDDVNVLSGGVLPGETSYAWKLALKLFQDLTADDSLVELSWSAKGTVLDFEYAPNTVADKQVTGQLVLSPIPVGGDEMKKRAQSDVEFNIVGDPAIIAIP